jgi:hypothetical protein
MPTLDRAAGTAANHHLITHLAADNVRTSWALLLLEIRIQAPT